jgi:F-type H+-transporting ATPase subunit a
VPSLDTEHAASAEDDHGEGHAGVLLEPVQGELLVDLSITRHLVFIWLGALIVFLIFRAVARRYEKGIGRETAPRGVFHNLFESLVIFVRDEIARPNLGDKTDRFLPYLLTAFFLIYTCNLLGLVPFGSTATSNISVTAVLATFTFVITQVSANREHWSHLFGPPGTPLLVRVILFPVEFLGLFTKPIALAIRLFANMTAGHLVILSLIGLIFLFSELFGPVAGYGISVVSIGFAFCIFLLELLVATIQAYIFTMLSALFIGMAVADHDHHHEDHEAAAHREPGAETAELAPAAQAALAT